MNGWLDWLAGWHLPLSRQGQRGQSYRQPANPEAQIGWLAGWLSPLLSRSPYPGPSSGVAGWLTGPLSLPLRETEAEAERPHIQANNQPRGLDGWVAGWLAHPSLWSLSLSIHLCLSRHAHRPASQTASQPRPSDWVAGWLAAPFSLSLSSINQSIRGRNYMTRADVCMCKDDPQLDL